RQKPVDPGNPSHRYQARSTAHLDRPCSPHGRSGGELTRPTHAALTSNGKACWRPAAASSPRATARPFGRRGLTQPPASNQGPACDPRPDVAQQPMANAGSKGLPVFRTPKHRTNNLRIAATTICLGLRRPRAFNRVTSATIAGLYRMADMAGM